MAGTAPRWVRLLETNPVPLLASSSNAATDIVAALDSLSRMGFGRDTPAVSRALDRQRNLQRGDGTFGYRLMKGKDRDLPWWICLAVCRSLKRWHDA